MLKQAETENANPSHLPALLLDWDQLDALKYAPCDQVCDALLKAFPLVATERQTVRQRAESLVVQTRSHARKQGVVESFLKEFSLGTREGLALMCLAESLLRTPDEATRDQLIAEKIASADWAVHMGHSENWFVNASTLGLMLTGRIVDVDERAKRDFGGYVTDIAARIGEPVIRRAVAQAIRIMGEQFVLGRNIEAAIKRATKESSLCSFDMLGEGARTEADAERYAKSYADAISTLTEHEAGAKGPEAGHGISVKLSALYSRYEAVKEAQVFTHLYPRIKALAIQASKARINFTLDAEETDRLVLSLKILDRLAQEPELKSWQGLGLAVQAYQKRSPKVIAMIADLARLSGRRLMVRLVKGAYWDTEIKRAQVMGREDYPVHTTKAATDLSYIVCAQALIEAAPHIYVQFATHNAHSLEAVRLLAQKAGVMVEYQRLHGMGEALYHSAKAIGDLRLRAYAPVGGHEDLLPYLVRRLLENGANSSFVHVLLDETIPPAVVIKDPFEAVSAAPGRHPRLPLPRHIYGDRLNSLGPDISIKAVRDRLSSAALDYLPEAPEDSTVSDVEVALKIAKQAQAAWDHRGGKTRADILDQIADGLEAALDPLCALLVAEAYKSWPDAIAEVREATDFCRYYAKLAREQFGEPTRLSGPAGERNHHLLHGRGVFVCISPWNFPLAIFTGQIMAALAAGNTVLAKPAEQTPRIAKAALAIFQAHGLPVDTLHLLYGPGETIGAKLTALNDIDGVAFTGGTDTAASINRTLANRFGPIIPFIAETGGLNAMFVDTTALKEQVIDDVILSAFGSAGQRCSALRILYIPKSQESAYVEALIGAMDTLAVGDTRDFATDIGCVIDTQAQTLLSEHVETLKSTGHLLHQVQIPSSIDGPGFAPTLARLDSTEALEREVFGPVLHLIPYDSQKPEIVAAALNAKGYGLTLGIHSRLESFAERIMHSVRSGNVYINRSQIGAVVGVQPFGGEGLSGTGPKAGGPLSLTRFASERAISNNITAQGGDPDLLNL